MIEVSILIFICEAVEVVCSFVVAITEFVFNSSYNILFLYLPFKPKLTCSTRFACVKLIPIFIFPSSILEKDYLMRIIFIIYFEEKFFNN